MLRMPQRKTIRERTGFIGYADIRDAMSQRFHRRSTRLKGYDYTRSGAYFITVCTADRRRLFGEVVNGVMVQNTFGVVVQRCWEAMPEHMPMMELDAFVVMPNHVHGIVVITYQAAPTGIVGAANSPPLPAVGAPPPPSGDAGSRRQVAIMVKNSLGHIMQVFKAAVSRQVIRDGLIPRGVPIWQRGYHDHIIRDPQAYERIARYIVNNPANWDRDGMNR